MHREKMMPTGTSFAKDWKEKIENRVIELCMPAYKKHLTLEDLKAIAAFYESPAGRKYKESFIGCDA